VPTAHDRVLLSPVEGARLVDAVVRFIVRTVELLTRYHPLAPAQELVALKQLGMP
jgi:hypothetical protein